MRGTVIAALLSGALLVSCGGLAGGGGIGGGVAPDVAKGARLPFGTVGRACGVSGAALGKTVDAAPSDARPRWRLHDTAPGSTAPRTHYLTGFSDGCPRQVTAALILFGAPLVHETHKTGLAASQQGAADAAYETARARICGGGPGTPCPASQIEALSQEIVFVSSYRDFTGTGSSYEILLGKGGVVAEGMGH
ncbi:hypothetical protein [Profundibacterium mesophilum]|uniref:Prokaryotic membrane lipoprotein lipid attachment site domain containing protein n=1 Tax=Profundibacterium mesophilum KAUST100406-0324 TaxID=1037889 RepID=A0A921NQY6_9RHOB|nr:hypothetical protein [Profundibacterium mesophilum]KAF0676837.1 Prokaryotic membrane lipoprotein lipid attachment site domain containing protein [Profundibacterium mesophilum KAUST100406-0324]